MLNFIVVNKKVLKKESPSVINYFNCKLKTLKLTFDIMSRGNVQ